MAASFDDVGHRRALIVGSGIAGLTAALELGDCTVVTAGDLGDGASRWAQGGIAAALGPDDAPERHATDTQAVSAGLADREVAQLVAAGAPERIGWLERLGARFDRDPTGRLALGREAGHGHPRIVHADGDATGAEVMRALVAAVRARPDIEVLAGVYARDLVRGDGRVVGLVMERSGGDRDVVLADAVVLATGGIGQVYTRTTNPLSACGDGLAMAIRAGATIRDPEFVQFHPTALDAPQDPLPLVTEALRGAGAVLVDASGQRYLADLHPDAELAPRDVVARANWEARRCGPIYLDATHLGPAFPVRFPTVFAAAQAHGWDPRSEPLPVTPAQHYHMGGVASDLDGRSSLPGLWVCGEVAATGLHGGNRLASNSLLEGLVFGGRVARSIAATASGRPTRGRIRGLELPAASTVPGSDEHDEALDHLRRCMWEHAGLVRDADGLQAGLRRVQRLAPRLEDSDRGRNLVAVARVVLEGALQRRGSRGSHVRRDHPHPGPARPTMLTCEPVPSRRIGTRAA